MSGEDVAATPTPPAAALQRRYESLASVRIKAVNGKGAWYWPHLEPILARNPESGAPKAVKLRCSLCSSLFSASNPSRTASEHLKRGTCPSFGGGGGGNPVTIATTITLAPTPSQKRSSSLALPPVPMPMPTPALNVGSNMSQPPLLVLSGGKEDLGALAILEDSVKRLKRSPGGKGSNSSSNDSATLGPGKSLDKVRARVAVGLLAEWLYESCGSVPVLSIEHPKFEAFLCSVGLLPLRRADLGGTCLDAKFEEVRRASDARLCDALFFQLAANGWNTLKPPDMPEPLVNVTLNLPNGTALFHKAIPLSDTRHRLSPKSIEDTLSAVLDGICGGAAERCAGIVADADKRVLKALRELEECNHWMVNLPCQVHGVSSLLKDFFKHLPLFGSVASGCRKVAALFSSKPLTAWSCLESFAGKLVRAPSELESAEFLSHPFTVALLEDIAGCGRALQIATADDAFKVAASEDPLGREVLEMLSGMEFWSDLEAAVALIRLVQKAVEEMEAERPSVSQCLPLWVDLRNKAKQWSAKYGKDEQALDQVLDKRFNKNYHPAWSASFVLDPLYLIRDMTGKYLPPFKYLTLEQEKDVDRLVTRLVLGEEAHIVLMELMKWRSNGLDPLYAQAVQMKERDPVTGKMKLASPQSRRLVWETCLSEYKALSKVAARLIFLHATSSGLKCDWPVWKWVYRNGNSRLAAEKAQKMIFIASHARLDRRDFASDEDKDSELFHNGGNDEETISDEISQRHRVNGGF